MSTGKRERWLEKFWNDRHRVDTVLLLLAASFNILVLLVICWSVIPRVDQAAAEAILAGEETRTNRKLGIEIGNDLRSIKADLEHLSERLKGK